MHPTNGAPAKMEVHSSGSLIATPINSSTKIVVRASWSVLASLNSYEQSRGSTLQGLVPAWLILEMSKNPTSTCQRETKWLAEEGRRKKDSR